MPLVKGNGKQGKADYLIGEERDGKPLKSGSYLQVVSHAGISRLRPNVLEVLHRSRGQTFL